MTRVSVIIVSYNTKNILINCLRAIYSSARGIEAEVFVVDNASTDGTVDAVRREFPQCRVMANETNVGFSGANNQAIRISSGRYILLLNPDTVVEPDVLTKMVEFMEEQHDVGMVSCKLVTRDGGLDLACRRTFPSLWDGLCRASGLSQWFPKSRLLARYNLTYLDEDQTCEVDAVNGAFMFARREAVEEVGLLDEDYFMYVEDLDWCFRFGKSGWKVVYHPAATTVHLKGQSGNPRSSAMIRELFRSTKLFYRKNCFADMGLLRRASILMCLDIWKWATLFRNTMRTNKRTRP
jgi:N-acetylglucosaminyl-diphospho-decaprenol L-rhamnosyltransferase